MIQRVCIYVTCSNEMSRMSANLISRKHRINMQLIRVVEIPTDVSVRQ